MGDQAPDVINNADVEDLGASQDVSEEHQKMAAEFNAQRARMKDLFLLKEEEMRKVISEKLQLESEIVGLREEVQQLRTLSQNQKSEIESFQLLLHETVEASSSACAAEVRKLQTKNLELEQQLNLVSKQASQEAALAPAALVRSLARKLVPDSEDDARKVGRHAQEDAESLRSLVEQLEEEIKALKEKLRSTDSQLQAQLALQPQQASGAASQGGGAGAGAGGAGGGGGGGGVACDMCRNYEQQLVAEQKESLAAQVKARDMDRALKLATEELESTRRIHEETIRSWRSERAESSAQMSELSQAVEACRRDVEERSRAADEATARVMQEVTSLTVQRQELQHAIDSLQKDNDMLLGKYTKKAIEMQNEDINLPDTVEELQEQLLSCREELLSAAVGREVTHNELMAARAQLADRLARDDHLLQQNTRLTAELEQLASARAQLNQLGAQLRRSGDKVEELLEDKKRLQNEVVELRGRISALQQDLHNNEQVQQDFVRLSQSLQVKLERIRESESEVRWQFEEDVSQCPDCEVHFTDNKQKQHCRHCGRVFCARCLAGSVPCGPRLAAAAVCSLCYTLLRHDAPPYFATQPPPTLPAHRQL